MVLGLELTDFWATVNRLHRQRRQRRPRPAAVAHQARHQADQHQLGRAAHQKSNYQDFQRFQAVDVGMAADAEATLPSLIEAVKVRAPERSQGGVSRSAARTAARPRRRRGRARSGRRDRLGRLARSRPRGCAAELYPHDQGPRLVDGRLGPADEQLAVGCGRWTSTTRTSARSGGYGVGYGLPASVGAALANKRSGASRSTSRPTAT